MKRINRPILFYKKKRNFILATLSTLTLYIISTATTLCITDLFCLWASTITAIISNSIHIKSKKPIKITSQNLTLGLSLCIIITSTLFFLSFQNYSSFLDLLIPSLTLITLLNIIYATGNICMSNIIKIKWTLFTTITGVVSVVIYTTSPILSLLIAIMASSMYISVVLLCKKYRISIFYVWLLLISLCMTYMEYKYNIIIPQLNVLLNNYSTNNSFYSNLSQQIDTNNINSKLELVTLFLANFFVNMVIGISIMKYKIYSPKVSSISQNIHNLIYISFFVVITTSLLLIFLLINTINKSITNSYIHNTCNTISSSYNNYINSPQRWIDMITKTNDYSIHIYSTDGNLLCSSNCDKRYTEMIPTGLHSSLIKQIRQNSDVCLVVDDSYRDQLEFLSAYRLISDDFILHIPFEKNMVLQDCGELIVWIVIIFILLLISLLFILIWIYQKITKPLDLLSNNINIMRSRGKIEDCGLSQSSDIAKVINQYNILVSELDKQHKYKILAERERTWNRMIKMVAHEIKNPLTPMVLKTHMLLKHIQDNNSDWKNEVEPTLNVILEQTNRMSKLIKKMTESPQEFIGEINHIDIKKFFEQIITLYSDYDNIKFNVNFQTISQASYSIYIRQEMLYIISTNIINNAIEALNESNTENGIIVIKVVVSESNLCLRFFNNGPTIEEHIRKDIFTYEYTTKANGSGIGLFYIELMLNAVSGNINVSSTKDLGTEFEINIPLN